VTVPFFGMAPYLLPGTDLVFTTSRHFAEHYVRRLLPLAIVRSPIDFPADALLPALAQPNPPVAGPCLAALAAVGGGTHGGCHSGAGCAPAPAAKPGLSCQKGL
jgi:hypothetical protein